LNGNRHLREIVGAFFLWLVRLHCSAIEAMGLSISDATRLLMLRLS
jgi:hypothetical protein